MRTTDFRLHPLTRWLSAPMGVFLLGLGFAVTAQAGRAIARGDGLTGQPFADSGSVWLMPLMTLGFLGLGAVFAFIGFVGRLPSGRWALPALAPLGVALVADSARDTRGLLTWVGWHAGQLPDGYLVLCVVGWIAAAALGVERQGGVLVAALISIGLVWRMDLANTVLVLNGAAVGIMLLARPREPGERQRRHAAG